MTFRNWTPQDVAQHDAKIQDMVHENRQREQSEGKRIVSVKSTDKITLERKYGLQSLTEHDHQKLVIAWARLHQKIWPELKMLFAIPNGGHRHKAVAAKMRAEGVSPGVPDLLLPVPRNSYAALWIELKRPGGKLSEYQKQWLKDLTVLGHRAVCCHGYQAAIDEMKNYLGD